MTTIYTHAAAADLLDEQGGVAQHAQSGKTTKSSSSSKPAVKKRRVSPPSSSRAIAPSSSKLSSAAPPTTPAVINGKAAGKQKLSADGHAVAGKGHNVKHTSSKKRPLPVTTNSAPASATVKLHTVSGKSKPKKSDSVDALNKQHTAGHSSSKQHNGTSTQPSSPQTAESIHTAPTTTTAKVKSTALTKGKNKASDDAAVQDADGNVDLVALNRWRRRALKYLDFTLSHERAALHPRKISRTGALYTAVIPRMLTDDERVTDRQRASDTGTVQFPFVAPHSAWTAVTAPHSSIGTGCRSLFPPSVARTGAAASAGNVRERRSTSMSPIQNELSANDTAVLLGINRCFTQLITHSAYTFQSNIAHSQPPHIDFDNAGAEVYAHRIAKQLDKQQRYNELVRHDFDLYKSVLNHFELLDDGNDIVLLPDTTQQLWQPRLKQIKVRTSPPSSANKALPTEVGIAARASPSSSPKHSTKALPSKKSPPVVRVVMEGLTSKPSIQTKLSRLKISAFVVHHLQ